MEGVLEEKEKETNTQIDTDTTGGGKASHSIGTEVSHQVPHQINPNNSVGMMGLLMMMTIS